MKNLQNYLRRVAKSIDAVLLSHADTLHLGALPYAMKQLGLSAPVYSTEPVYRLGLLTMYDHYLSRKVRPSMYLLQLASVLLLLLLLLYYLELELELEVEELSNYICIIAGSVGV